MKKADKRVYSETYMQEKDVPGLAGAPSGFQPSAAFLQALKAVAAMDKKAGS